MTDKRKPVGKPGRKSAGTPGRKAKRPTKDRVLQARIPEQLDDQLRNRADSLGLSVSTIVRNVLLNTFDLVEDVVTDSARISSRGKSSMGHRAWQASHRERQKYSGSCSARPGSGET